MKNRFQIYGLVDPSSLLIRYIGKSCSGIERTLQHLKTYKNIKTYCANWIRSLQRNGLQPDIVLLELHQNAESLIGAERWWIAYGRACGWPLTNLTDGGEGASGYKMKPEQIARLKSDQNPMKSPDVRARASAWMSARSISEETRKKQSDFNKRPEVNKVITSRMLGDNNPMSHTRWKGERPTDREEVRNKISATLKGHTVSAETRAKLSAANRTRQERIRLAKTGVS